VVEPIHEKAMPVILTALEEIDTGYAPWADQAFLEAATATVAVAAFVTW
jgi:hypothetical protein